MENSLIIIRGTTEVYRFPFSQIVFIEADGPWCKVYTDAPRNEKHDAFNPQGVPMLLKEVWELICEQIDRDHTIFHSGRSYLINPDYVRKIDVTKKKLLMADRFNHYELELSREALVELRVRFEEELRARAARLVNHQ